MTNNRDTITDNIILEYVKAIEARIMDIDDPDAFHTLDRLTYSDNGGIDFEEPEVPEDDPRFATLMTLREIAIAILD